MNSASDDPAWSRLSAQSAWLPEGWQGPVAVDAAGGRIVEVSESDHNQTPGHGQRWLLPGIPNLHSHAFQRAMAGFAERRGDRADSAASADSFWTWRETMYAFAGRMTPETLNAVASHLYVEMLEAGYTWVCEFHYLHHQADGTPYANPAAMSEAIIAAARDTGIGLTLLPVLYMTGGFDGRPLNPRQRRFGHELDAYLKLLDGLRAHENDRLRLGVALHSLRAVPPEAMSTLLASGVADDRPIHIHIAEQLPEVQDCLALRGARPVEWLLDHAPVDDRWCLVHATHMTAAETRAVAASGATVALCPTTEANLGDGLFPLREYLAADGAWGIGSDSHISVSPVEELRWLEYGQRLTSHHRNIAASDDTASVGETLLAGALYGGRACGAAIGAIEGAGNGFPGMQADLLTLAAGHPVFAGHDDDTVLDAWLFSGNRPVIADVWAGGRQVVFDGRHGRRDEVAAAYGAALTTLRAAS